MLYFNEFEPFAAEWLRNLYPAAHVDERSIADVDSTDLVGYRRCHFFAGIAGWPVALRLAGYDWLECWSGSAPCQPFSTAGKQKGIEDERHLWPVWFKLIDAVRPPIVFGEQVSSAIAHGWLDGVFADLEGAGYTCGACVLGAHSVGAPHIRQRLYWGAVRNSWLRDAKNGRASNEKQGEMPRESDQWLLDSHNDGRETGRIATEATRYGSASDATGRGLRNPVCDGLGSGGRTAADVPAQPGDRQILAAWSDYTIAEFRDGKKRRVGSGVQPLAFRVPKGMGRGEPELRDLLRRASQNRTGRLKAYGNTIVPQVAAVFVRAFMESIDATL